jgi:hypothetical protein
MTPFPVMKTKGYPGCPEAVPWSAVAPHEARAMRNHGQSLARLAERGGLHPRELYAVLTDRLWHDVQAVTVEEVVAVIVRVARVGGGT